MSQSAKPPPGVVLAPLSARVFQVLAQYTAFPWPVMLAQCRRHDIDPALLSPSDLVKVLPHLVEGVARFTSPEKGEAVREALERLTVVR